MGKNAAAEADTGNDDKGLGMDDAIGAALDALDNDGGAQGTDVEATVDTGNTAGEVDEAADKQAKADQGRERNPDGTFKAKTNGTDTADETQTVDDDDPDKQAATADDDAAKAAEAVAKKAAEEAEAAAPQLVDGRDIKKAPTTWKPEAAAEFAKLPESVRREVHKREEDIHRGLEQYKTAAQFGSEIANVFKPYKQLIEETQIAPTHLVDAALQFEKAMRTGTREQKIQVLTDLAKAYGLVEQKDEQGNVVQPDPRYTALETKVTGLERQLTEREMAAQKESVRNEIAAFKSDPKHKLYSLVQSDMAALITNKQADTLHDAYWMTVLSNPSALTALKAEHEHIELVKEDVLRFLLSGQGADFKDAYDKATWVNPVTRAKLLTRQQEAQRKEAADKAAAANRANLVNVKPRATPSGKTSGKGTVDDGLNAALDTLGVH